MRFRVDPRDIPPEMAARRLGITLARFDEVKANLFARGFPKPDPDTGNYDGQAVDRWCDARHPDLMGETAALGARDARSVVPDRIAKLKAGARHG